MFLFILVYPIRTYGDTPLPSKRCCVFFCIPQNQPVLLLGPPSSGLYFAVSHLSAAAPPLPSKLWCVFCCISFTSCCSSSALQVLVCILLYPSLPAGAPPLPSKLCSAGQIPSELSTDWKLEARVGLVYLKDVVQLNK